jgi:transcription antitermination factor NusG
MTKTLRTWCDRKKYIDMPLFPSYVFVYLRNMQDYYCGLNNDGVLYYVKMGKNIVCVGEDVISNIQLAVDKGNGVEVSENYFQPGQKLVVQKGPLTGLSCELIHYNGKQKLLVRVHLLQRNLLVTMPAEHLMAVSA